MGSLPDSKKKNIPRSVHEMSKEMLQETLKKKKECNAKALEIVEKLCESRVEENWFLENLQFINQCHFDDVTVERCISKICGYPLCNQQLKNVPAQKYHISLRYKKVFDITERKNFCSSHCYKSAVHVKNQLFTSPLWFRDQEVIPNYTVLKSSLNDESAFSTDKIKQESENDIQAEDLNKSESGDKDLKELDEKYSDLNVNSSAKVFPDKTLSKTHGGKNFSGNKETVMHDLGREDSTLKQEIKKKNDSSKISNVDCHDKISRDHQFQNSNKIKTKAKPDKPDDTIKKIEKSILEWFSLHTLFLLYGEEKLRELFYDKADEIKRVLNSKLSNTGLTDRIDRVIQLYGLLDADLFSKKESKMNLKPLPDFAALKKEKDTVEIKVKAFYQGQLEVKQSVLKEKEEAEDSAKSEVISLPLVDAHSQIPLRRKILLDKLNRVIPDLIKVFSQDYNLDMNEVRNLVTTFTLSAHNIIFKPYEWYLVGIILIKLLSLRNKELESIIKLESSENQILLILTSFKLQKEYLNNLIIRLTESKTLLKKICEIEAKV